MDGPPHARNDRARRSVTSLDDMKKLQQGLAGLQEQYQMYKQAPSGRRDSSPDKPNRHVKSAATIAVQHSPAAGNYPDTSRSPVINNVADQHCSPRPTHPQLTKFTTTSNSCYEPVRSDPWKMVASDSDGGALLPADDDQHSSSSDGFAVIVRNSRRTTAEPVTCCSSPCPQPSAGLPGGLAAAAEQGDSRSSTITCRPPSTSPPVRRQPRNSAATGSAQRISGGDGAAATACSSAGSHHAPPGTTAAAVFALPRELAGSMTGQAAVQIFEDPELSKMLADALLGPSTSSTVRVADSVVPGAVTLLQRCVRELGARVSVYVEQCGQIEETARQQARHLQVEVERAAEERDRARDECETAVHGRCAAETELQDLQRQAGIWRHGSGHPPTWYFLLGGSMFSSCMGSRTK